MIYMNKIIDDIHIIKTGNVPDPLEIPQSIQYMVKAFNGNYSKFTYDGVECPECKKVFLKLKKDLCVLCSKPKSKKKVKFSNSNLYQRSILSYTILWE